MTYKNRYERERVRLMCTEEVLYKALDLMSKRKLKELVKQMIDANTWDMIVDNSLSVSENNEEVDYDSTESNDQG